jgi:hypothetical protein
MMAYTEGLHQNLLLRRQSPTAVYALHRKDYIFGKTVFTLQAHGLVIHTAIHMAETAGIAASAIKRD